MYIVTKVSKTIKLYNYFIHNKLFEQVGVNDKGVVQYLIANIYENSGVALNDPVVPILLIPTFPLIYDSSTWTVNGYDVRSDRAASSWMRGPGKCINHLLIYNLCIN